jgi:hypothetical protein
MEIYDYNKESLPAKPAVAKPKKQKKIKMNAAPKRPKKS